MGCGLTIAPTRLIEKLSVLAALLLFYSFDAQSSVADGSPAGLYHDYCSVCHGETGDGRSHAVLGMEPKPRDFTSPESRAAMSRIRMIAAITHGVPGTAMVGWKTQLSASQIESIVDYVREHLMGMDAAPMNTGDGESIYAFSCSVCHGEDGNGAMWGAESMDPPPIAFRDYDPEQTMPRARMIASVTHGRPGTSMMSFESQLSAEQIELVVDYVRGRFMIENSEDPGAAAEETITQPDTTVGLAVIHGRDRVPRTTLPDPDPDNVDLAAVMPFGLEGDGARGGSYFAQSCTACHGHAGDGNGPRAYFIFPRPVSFVAAENRSRLNRPGLFRSIKYGVRGREMPAWGKVLDDQEIADIAEFVFNTFVQTDSEAQKQSR